MSLRDEIEKKAEDISGSWFGNESGKVMVVFLDEVLSLLDKHQKEIEQASAKVKKRAKEQIAFISPGSYQFYKGLTGGCDALVTELTKALKKEE